MTETKLDIVIPGPEIDTDPDAPRYGTRPANSSALPWRAWSAAGRSQ